jgi:hypothetical protein
VPYYASIAYRYRTVPYRTVPARYRTVAANQPIPVEAKGDRLFDLTVPYGMVGNVRYGTVRYGMVYGIVSLCAVNSDRINKLREKL